MSEKGLAIISGEGALPQLIAQKCASLATQYHVVTFKTLPLTWSVDHPEIHAKFEKLGRLFSDMNAAGITKVVFAGAMNRPKLSEAEFDVYGRALSDILTSANNAGDDATLRAIARLFEVNGFVVIGAHEFVPEILPNVGTETKRIPSELDGLDITRAAQIVRALGEADVGQGAVVAQTICLGLESIQGTDQMLDFVQKTRENYTKTPQSGVLYKAAKPHQDLRFDMPAIGPQTMLNAAKAGLSGVAIEFGQVMILDPEETLKISDKLNLFLVVMVTK